MDYDKRNIEHAQPIVDFYSQKYADIRELRDANSLIKANDYHEFIQIHKLKFESYAKEMYADYHVYIDAIVNKQESVGLIDSKTVAFTSQKCWKMFYSDQFKASIGQRFCLIEPRNMHLRRLYRII
ncbi:hypothetical protein ACFSHO_03255 [Acinetobacter vivianii]